MTTYTISVNGKSYDVVVEKKGGAASPNQATIRNTAAAHNPDTVSTPPISAPAPAISAASNPMPPSGGGVGSKITAPMPGKVISVNVSVGDKVKKGQHVIVLEAMKMHNPVLASSDGEIKEVFVKANDPVQVGQVLLTIG